MAEILSGKYVANRDNRNQIKNGLYGSIVTCQKAPSDQSHGKHQWNNIVLNQARIEQKDAKQQAAPTAVRRIYPPETDATDEAAQQTLGQHTADR